MSSQKSPNGTVELTIENNVARLRSTNPSRHNCISFDFVEDLLHHIDVLEDRKDEIYAITITHSGEVYCSGFDLDVISGDDPEARTELADKYGACYDWLINVDIPVVTGAKGPAVAMGAGHLKAGDIVVVGPEFRIWWSEIDVGRFPYGMGASFMEKYGIRRAAELTFLGKEAKLTPEESRELGLVNRIVDTEQVDDTVRDIGETLADNHREYGYLLKGYEVFNTAKRYYRQSNNAGTAEGDWLKTYDQWFSENEPLTGGGGDPREE